MKRWLFLHRNDELGHVNEFVLRSYGSPGDEYFQIETEAVKDSTSRSATLQENDAWARGFQDGVTWAKSQAKLDRL